MRNLKFYEIALGELSRRATAEKRWGGRGGREKRTDFQATKLSREPRVTPILPKLAGVAGARPVRTADNDWKQRQRTATSLIVTLADCFMTVLLFRRTRAGTRARARATTLPAVC